MSPAKREPTKSCLTRTLATPSRRSRACISPSKKRNLGFCTTTRVRTIPMEGRGRKVLEKPRLFSPRKQLMDEPEQVRLARERTGSKEMEDRRKLYKKWRKTIDARLAIEDGESRERLAQRFRAFIMAERERERKATELKNRMRLSDEESLRILMDAEARRRDRPHKGSSIAQVQVNDVEAYETPKYQQDHVHQRRTSTQSQKGIHVNMKSDRQAFSSGSNSDSLLSIIVFAVASIYLQSKLLEWGVSPFWQDVHALFLLSIIGLAIATILKK